MNHYGLIIFYAALSDIANFQKLLTGSVLIGGSAGALHLKHRYSLDADHILSDLKENSEAVLDFLEGRDDWETPRINPPKLILEFYRKTMRKKFCAIG